MVALALGAPSGAAAPVSLSGPGTEGVHQPAEGVLKETVFSDKPAVDIASCFADRLRKAGRQQTTPRPKGFTVELYAQGLFGGGPGDPVLIFEITDQDRRRIDLYTTWLIPKPGKLWVKMKTECLDDKSQA